MRSERSKPRLLHRATLLLGFFVFDGCAPVAPVRPTQPWGVAVAPSFDADSVPAYHRSEWQHWTDDDYDCQDTRTEVLVAESETPVEFRDERHCKVARGRWTCPYTAQVITDPRKLDVDHLVPLENAHRSGGWRWSREKKRNYANDLAAPEHLVVVLASANRAKGSKGPEEWLPHNPAFVCEYIREWTAVKTRWALSSSAPEQQAVERARASCTQ